MDLDALHDILEGTNLPVTYRAWPTEPARNLPPPLPWICFMETRPDNFAADGIVYHSEPGYRIELYTAEKDPASEQAVESALTAAGLFYNKEETFLTDENDYEIIYEI